MANRPALDPFGDGSLVDSFTFTSLEDGSATLSNQQGDNTFGGDVADVITDPTNPIGYNEHSNCYFVSSSGNQKLSGNVSATVCGWYKHPIGDDNWSEATFGGQGNDGNFGIGADVSSGTLTIRGFINGSGYGLSNPTTDDWVFIACTYDASIGRVSFYVNGDYIGYADVTITFDDTKTIDWYDQNKFAKLTDFQLYNRVLTEQELDDIRLDNFITAKPDAIPLTITILEPSLTTGSGVLVDDYSYSNGNSIKPNILDDGSNIDTYTFNDNETPTTCNTNKNHCFDFDTTTDVIKALYGCYAIYYNGRGSVDTSSSSLPINSNNISTSFYLKNYDNGSKSDILFELDDISNNQFFYVDIRFGSPVIVNIAISDNTSTKLDITYEIGEYNNTYFNIFVTFDNENSKCYLYIDGVFVASFVYDDIVQYKVSDNCYYNFYSANGEAFGLRVFNKVVNSSEIEDIITYDASNTYLLESKITPNEPTLKLDSYINQDSSLLTTLYVLEARIQEPLIFADSLLLLSNQNSVVATTSSKLFVDSLLLLSNQNGVVATTSSKLYANSISIPITILTPPNTPIEADSIFLNIIQPLKYEAISTESLLLTQKLNQISVTAFPIIDGMFVSMNVDILEPTVIYDKNYFITSTLNIDMTINTPAVDAEIVEIFGTTVEILEPLYLEIFANCGYGFYGDVSTDLDIFNDGSGNILCGQENSDDFLYKDYYFTDNLTPHTCNYVTDDVIFGTYSANYYSVSDSYFGFYMQYYKDYYDSFTLSFWYKPTSSDDGYVCWLGETGNDNESFSIRIIDGNFQVSNSDDYVTPTLTDTNIIADTNKWFLITITVSSSTIGYYIDDYSLIVSSSASGYLSGDCQFAIGYKGTSTSPSFKTDQFRIFSKVLSDSELSALKTEQKYLECSQHLVKVEPVNIEIYIYEPYVSDELIIVGESLLNNISIINPNLIYSYKTVIDNSILINIRCNQPNYVGGVSSSTGTPTIDYTSTIFAQSLKISIAPLYLKLGENVYIKASLGIITISNNDIHLWDRAYPSVSTLTIKTNANIAQPKVNPRVYSIGDLVFNTHLYWSRNTEDIRYVQKSSVTVNGDTVVSVMKLKDFNISSTITTEKDFSITYNEYIQLSSMVTDDIYDIILTDGTIIRSKFDLTNKPVEFTPIFNGSDRFYVNIKVLV